MLTLFQASKCCGKIVTCFAEEMLLGRRVTLNFEADTNFKKIVTAFILRVILLLFI